MKQSKTICVRSANQRTMCSISPRYMARSSASLNRKPRRMSHRGEFGISLKKAWWGCGAASALTEAILAFAKENGFEQLNLEVRSSNARAIRLYEKYGFRKLCTFPHFFKINGEYIDFDRMNLELNTADDHIEENMR